MPRLRAHQSASPKTGRDSETHNIIDIEKLRALKRAAQFNDWVAAADTYLEIALEKTGHIDSVRVDALATALRLQDAEAIATLVDEPEEGGANP